MADIIVEYDGEYPTTCMGTLRIFVDGKEVYNKMYACSSTGMWRRKNDAIIIGEGGHEGYEVHLSIWYDHEKPNHKYILVKKANDKYERVLFNVSSEDINNYFKEKE